MFLNTELLSNNMPDAPIKGFNPIKMNQRVYNLENKMDTLAENMEAMLELMQGKQQPQKTKKQQLPPPPEPQQPQVNYQQQAINYVKDWINTPQNNLFNKVFNHAIHLRLLDELATNWDNHQGKRGWNDIRITQIPEITQALQNLSNYGLITIKDNGYSLDRRSRIGRAFIKFVEELGKK